MRLILSILSTVLVNITFGQFNEPLNSPTTDIFELQKLKETKKVYTTASIRGKSINIDLILDDGVWNAANWAGDFIQREPKDGGAVNQQTAFKIVYDDRFLYRAYSFLMKLTYRFMK